MLSDHYEAGTIDLTRLVARWKLLEQLYEVTRVTLAERRKDVLHARMIDENLPAGHRVYMVAERYLSIAWDNHAAFCALIQGSHGVTMSAPWNLLRPTFEAAFYATWVLDPDESLERRRRALRVEYLDEIEHRRYYEEVLKMKSAATSEELETSRVQLSERRAKNEASYGADAAALGMKFPPSPVVVLDQLGGLSHCAGLADADVLLRLAWRNLSGHQHGRGSAMLRDADRDDRHPTPGGIFAVVAVNDDAFFEAADVTTNMHMGAVELLLRRSRP